MRDDLLVAGRDPIAAVAERFAALADDPVLAARADAVVADLRDDATADAASDALARLCAAFELSAFERDLLVLVGLPEEHEAFTYLARLLHPRGEPHLSVGAVAAALQLDAGGRRHLRDAVEAGPLHANGIVLADGPGPLPEAGLRLAPGLWSVMRGHDHWPSGLRPRPTAAVSGPSLPAVRLAPVLDGTRRVVLVTGASNRTDVELAALVRGAAVEAGRAVVVVPAADLTDEVATLLTVHTVARGVHPVVVGRPTAAPLPDHPGTVVLCVDDALGLPLDDRAVVVLELGERRLGESVAMWRSLVPELNGGAEQLAGLLRVDHLRASRAVADARAAADSGGDEVTVSGILGHTRRRTDSDLPSSGRLVRPAATWDDLVTTPDNTALLRSVVDRVRGQVRVLHEWGFGARSARGVRALLSGPPGTGKTLSAHIVAAALDLDLLVVDLSALVSKWLGETEKNISEVFAAAERSQAILFFDEADAIFGKRTDGNDAQARWANLETAHLLARIDAFDGLVVLATNLRGHIDEAFVRRLDVIVEFDEPGPDERRRLWAAHLPTGAPLAPDVDLDQLAGVYQVTGGLIRNAALTAAYRAAAEDRPIDQRTLLDAVAREYQKAGRSFPGMPRGLVGTPSGGT